MEWEDFRLLPSALLLTMSGVAAMVLALGAAIEGHALLPVVVGVALLLLVAGGWLAPDRRWSLRLGSIAAAFGIPMWLVALVALDRPNDATIGLFCLAMAAACGWTMRFLRDELLPPEWLRTYPDSGPSQEASRAEGWIEDLPADALLRI